MEGLLQADTTHVVHETIDGEAILIHLGTGTYYSLDGVGAEVWALLTDGVTRDGLLSAGRARYDGDPVEVERGLSGLVDDLVREGLVVESEGRGDTVELPAGTVPFVAPVLHIYTDMQDFMLVDPLREADDLVH